MHEKLFIENSMRTENSVENLIARSNEYNEHRYVDVFMARKRIRKYKI